MTPSELREAVARAMVSKYTRDQRRHPEGRDREVADAVLAVVREAQEGGQ